MTLAEVDSGYLELIKQFPLAEIDNDSMHKRALTVLNKYAGKQLTNGQLAYMKILAALIDQYERLRYPVTTMSPREVVKSLMDLNNLKQADLISCFGSRSQVNDFLVGRRNLSKQQIRRLSEKFSIAADCLLGEANAMPTLKRISSAKL